MKSESQVKRVIAEDRLDQIRRLKCQLEDAQDEVERQRKRAAEFEELLRFERQLSAGYLARLERMGQWNGVGR
jgi:hypothetical protein